MLWERIQTFLTTPPSFADDAQNRLARVINAILLVTLLMNIVFIVAGLTTPDYKLVNVITIALVIEVVLFVLLRLRQSLFSSELQLLIPSVALPLIALVAITILVSWGGGLRDVGMLAYPLVAVMASLLLGKRGAIAFGGLTALTVAGLAYFELRGMLVNAFSHATTSGDVIVAPAVISLTAALTYFLVSGLTSSLERVRQSERELQMLTASLEQRAADRARDLKLANDIGQTISAVRDVNELLARAVELIQSSFDLYHVQVYLTDTLGKTLILRASTGEAGKVLLSRYHRLPLNDNSINGAAALTKRTFLVAETVRSPHFRPNPLLPETRCEMAVPLLVSGRVIGVLDLQHKEPGGLGDLHKSIFEMVAGLLAVAVENGVLFTELRQAHAEVEVQARRQAREGWHEFLDAINRGERLGTTYDVQTDTVITQPVAMPVDAEASVLEQPVVIAGEPVGTLRLEAEETRTWSDDDLGLVQAVAEQVAQQIENLRLLAQAEQYRLEAEQAVKRLTREGWESYVQAKPELLEAGFIYDGTVVRQATGEELAPSAWTQVMALHGQVVGEISAELPDEITPEVEQIMTTVTEQLTEHIENLRLTQETQMALARTETLYAISSQVSRASSIAEVLQAAAQPGIESGASHASLLIFELDDFGTPLWAELAASWQFQGPPPIAEGTRFYLPEFALSKVWQTHRDARDRCLFIADTRTDPRLDEAARNFFRQLGATAAALLPLTLGGRWIGEVLIHWTTVRQFTDQDARLYESLTAQAAVAVNSRLLFEQTQRRANRETLINRITQKIQSTATVQSALQTAIQELGLALRAKETRVELSLPRGEADEVRLGNGDSHSG